MCAPCCSKGGNDVSVFEAEPDSPKEEVCAVVPEEGGVDEALDAPLNIPRTDSLEHFMEMQSIFFSDPAVDDLTEAFQFIEKNQPKELEDFLHRTSEWLDLKEKRGNGDTVFLAACRKSADLAKIVFKALPVSGLRLPGMTQSLPNLHPKRCLALDERNDKSEETPLDIALLRKDMKLLEFLVEKGASVFKIRQAQWLQEERPDLYRKLVKQGKPPLEKRVSEPARVLQERGKR